MGTRQQRGDLIALQGREVQHASDTDEVERGQIFRSPRQAHRDERHLAESGRGSPLVEQGWRDQVAIAHDDVWLMARRDGKRLRRTDRPCAVGTEPTEIAAQVLAEIGVASHAEQTHARIYRVRPRKFRSHG